MRSRWTDSQHGSLVSASWLESSPWSIQSIAQTVQRNIEVVASRGMSVVGPLQLHQHVAPDWPAAVDQQVLEYGPRLQAVRAPGNYAGKSPLASPPGPYRDAPVQLPNRLGDCREDHSARAGEREV